MVLKFCSPELPLIVWDISAATEGSGGWSMARLQDSKPQPTKLYILHTEAQLYTDICNTHTHCFSPLQKQRHTIINYRQIHTDIDAPSYTKIHEYRHTKLQSAHGHSASMDTHARPGTPSSTAKPVTHT